MSKIVEYLGQEQEAAIRINDNTRVWLRTAEAIRKFTDKISVLAFRSTKSCCFRRNRRENDAGAVANDDERSEFDALAFFCLLPSLLYVLCMFVYPFLYGVYLSLQPQKVDGFSFANYLAFFSDPYQYGTIWITFSLAIPTTIVVLVLALWLAYGMRRASSWNGP